MTLEKLPSGSYRAKMQVNKKRYSVTFDHKPTQLEITKAFSEIVETADSTKDSFNICAKSYIQSKSNVLSPSTIRGYNSILKNSISEDFKKLKMANITQKDIQLEINRYASNHSPKTTRNLHGFISSVMAMFRPNMVINTTLPQKVVYEAICPEESDIKKLLKATEGTIYHIPFQLGILGLRRSEIISLTKEDLEGNILHINKAEVFNQDNKKVIKTTKTESSTRDIYIPDSLAQEIQEAECIYNGYPNSLLRALHRYQRELQLPNFRFHDLRHFYASYAHSKGMSDADIMASGGWKTDYTMKSVYRHSMEKNKQDAQKKIANSLL